MENIGSVNKGKKVYGKPMLISEEFVPNQYVAACETYKIACKWSECNEEQDLESNSILIHRENNCGSLENNAVVTNKNGDILSVVEKNTIMGDDLPMSITTPGVTNLTEWVGKEIEWDTSWGSYEWHHKGVVTSVPSDIGANHS